MSSSMRNVLIEESGFILTHAEGSAGLLLNRARELAAQLGTIEKQPNGFEYTIIDSDYNGTGYIDWHADSYDVTILVCLNQAATGGEFRLLRSDGLHDALARASWNSFAVAHEPWERSKRWRDGRGPMVLPVFDCRGAPQTYLHFDRHRERYESDETRTGMRVRRALNDLASLCQIDTLWCFDSRLRRGDIVIFNNRRLLHSRLPFNTDPPRRIARLWLKLPDSPYDQSSRLKSVNRCSLLEARY